MDVRRAGAARGIDAIGGRSGRGYPRRHRHFQSGRELRGGPVGNSAPAPCHAVRRGELFGVVKATYVAGGGRFRRCHPSSRASRDDRVHSSVPDHDLSPDMTVSLPHSPDLPDLRRRTIRRRGRRGQRRVLRAEGRADQGRAAPEWREGVYTERGKWMDGWETRRRRDPGYDWAIVRLGLPGIVHGVVIDTSFFTGNYPERASIEACAVDGRSVRRRADRRRAPTGGRCCLQSIYAATRANPFAVDAGERRVTHLRLNIFPDGGVARLRVHGDVVPDDRVFARARGRSRGDGERRLRRLVQRHALRPSAEPHHARTLDAHGRRLGDEAPARPGSRLDDRSPRAARRRSSASSSTPITSRATRRAAACSSTATRRRRAIRRRHRRTWTSSSHEPPLQPHARHVFDDLASAVRRRTFDSTSIPTAVVAHLLVGRTAT